MTDNVVIFPGETTLDIPIERVLDGAKGQVEGMVLVLGWEKDGGLYVASNKGDGKEALWLAEKFIHKLMAGDFG